MHVLFQLNSARIMHVQLLPKLPRMELTLCLRLP